MTSLILALVAALASPFSFAGQHVTGEVRTTVLEVQGWRLGSQPRPLPGSHDLPRCARGPMTLDHGVMVFKFPARDGHRPGAIQDR